MTIHHWRCAALLSGLLILGQPGSAMARTPIGPMPLGSQGNWVTTEDYPSRALRYEEQSVVGFQLHVDPTGVPTSCKVVETSKSDALDTKTCNLLMERARFAPALDDAGNPTEGSYRNSVRWTIPEDAPTEIGPAEMIVRFDIGPDGLPKNCKVEKAEGLLPFPAGEPCGPRDRFVVPVGKDGKPLVRRVKVRMVVEVEDVPSAQ